MQVQVQVQVLIWGIHALSNLGSPAHRSSRMGSGAFWGVLVGTLCPTYSVASEIRHCPSGLEGSTARVQCLCSIALQWMPSANTSHHTNHKQIKSCLASKCSCSNSPYNEMTDCLNRGKGGYFHDALSKGSQVHFHIQPAIVLRSPSGCNS